MRAVALTLLLAGCAEPALWPGFDGQTYDVVRGTDPVMPPPPGRDFAPPPISGGTLLALKATGVVMASDPDTDMVWRMNLSDTSSLTGLMLAVGDEPGRLVEDSAGRVHVVLRRAGAIASVQAGGELKLLSRRAACVEPRGIAYDPASDRVHVACGDGQLVSFAASGGEAVSRLRLDDDLRDLAVVPGGFLVSRFHSAQLLAIDASGAVISRAEQPAFTTTPFAFDGGVSSTPRSFEPGVAWRMIMTPQGAAMTYQLGQTTPISLSGPLGFDAGFGSSAYGGSGCEPGVVQSMLMLPTMSGNLPLFGTLPVDVAMNSFEASVVAAGSNVVLSMPLAQPPPPPGGPCIQMVLTRAEMTVSQPVAITYAGDVRVVQLRDPGALTWNGQRVTFPVSGRRDEGHQLFHAEQPAGLACASCHPEGREDGRVWNFEPDGARRTQNLAGGILATAPFHWDGALLNLDALMSEVLVRRMGSMPTLQQRQAVGPWVESIPRPAARGADVVAAERGKALFESPAVGCAACHSGSHFTNNTGADVGTGGRFQVPALAGVSARAPFMHDGCAATLEDRFGACGGGDRHGTTSQLSAAEVSDLVAYLKTL